MKRPSSDAYKQVSKRNRTRVHSGTFTAKTHTNCSAPDHPQSIGGNPLVLLIHQTAVTTKGEEAIKTLLKLMKRAGFDIHHGRQLSMAIEALLVGQRQFDQTDGPEGDKAQLHAKSQEAAKLFAALSLELKLRSKGGGIQGWNSLGLLTDDRTEAS